MDPLSDILTLLKPRSTVSAGFDAGGDWSVDFPAYAGIKFNAIVTGRCWLALDGLPEALRLEAGDCFLLPQGRPFRLASDLSLPSIASDTVFTQARHGGIARLNGGGDFFLAGARFALSGHHAGLLIEALPPIVHIRKEADQTTLRWLLDRMQQELRDPQPGSSLVTRDLAQMMLIQALRLHLGTATGATGWLSALADKQMAQAIAAMHADPARRWTVGDLAAGVGMSRTAFAVRFKRLAGISPIDYLTRWRMSLAGERLRARTQPTADIAAQLGYDSDSAFGAAFKRVMGCAPRQYGNIPRAEVTRPAAQISPRYSETS
ncbi:MAG TPA: AraC family transcriptional regulator [Paenirhodobacter sp.]